jgi:hypothetical protein
MKSFQAAACSAAAFPSHSGQPPTVSSSCRVFLSALGLPQPSRSYRPHHIYLARIGHHLIRRGMIRGVSLKSIMTDGCGRGKGKVGKGAGIRQQGAGGRDALIADFGPGRRQAEGIGHQGARDQTEPLECGMWNEDHGVPTGRRGPSPADHPHARPLHIHYMVIPSGGIPSPASRARLHNNLARDRPNGPARRVSCLPAFLSSYLPFCPLCVPASPREKINRLSVLSCRLKVWIPAPDQVEGRLFAGMTYMVEFSRGSRPSRLKSFVFSSYYYLFKSRFLAQIFAER